MFRLALYVGGISAAVVGYALLWNQQKATRRIPVKEAAAKLQQAWADHNTVA
jgi:hypothetical protein